MGNRGAPESPSEGAQEIGSAPEGALPVDPPQKGQQVGGQNRDDLAVLRLP